MKPMSSRMKQVYGLVSRRSHVRVRRSFRPKDDSGSDKVTLEAVLAKRTDDRSTFTEPDLDVKP
jgi:hypothetical protein